MNIKTLICSFCLCIFSVAIHAQKTNIKSFVEINLKPNHADWIYKTGEKVSLEITATKGGETVQHGEIQYTYGMEMMPTEKSGSTTLKNGLAIVQLDGAKEPGFKTFEATITIDGNKYSNFITVGFDPSLIMPATPLPTDFLSFWSAQKKKWDSEPLCAKMDYQPSKSTDKVDVYNISYNYNGKPGAYGAAKFFGVLSIPKAPGKYPAIYYLPGAGVRSYKPLIEIAEKGFITLQIGIHGIPIDMAEEVYQLLRVGALADYPSFCNNSRDKYYYNRVYNGCVRGVSFIFGLDKFDGTNIATWGGSQGGNLSLAVSAIDPRIKCSVVIHPALTDMEGHLYGRAGGWPHQFKNSKLPLTDSTVVTARYYDGINFARQLTKPIIFSWGFNDKTCGPTTSFAAYNITTAPKDAFIVPNTGHWTFAEQQDSCLRFVMKHFGMK